MDKNASISPDIDNISFIDTINRKVNNNIYNTNIKANIYE